MNHLNMISKIVLMSVLLMTQAFVNVDAAGRTRSAASGRPARPAAERLEARRDARINGPLRRPVGFGPIAINPVVNSNDASSDASSQAPSSPLGSSSGVDADTRSSVTIESVSSDDSDVDTAPKMSAADQLLAMLAKAPIATRNAITAKEARWRDGNLGHDEALKAASRWKNSRYKELFIQMIVDAMNLEKISDEKQAHVDSALSRGEFEILTSASLGSTSDGDRDGHFDDDFFYDNGASTPTSPAASEKVDSADSRRPVVINFAPEPLAPAEKTVDPTITEMNNTMLKQLLADNQALRTDVAGLREAHALQDERDVETREEKAQAKQRKAEAKAAAQRRSSMFISTIAVVVVAGAAYTVWHFGGVWEVIGKVKDLVVPLVPTIETVKEVVVPAPVDPTADMNFISKVTYRITQGINIFNPLYTV